MKKDLEQYIQDHILSSLNDYYPRYVISVGRGDRIYVDEKIIKGILFTPTRGHLFFEVKEHIDFIIKLIGADIKRGRFIGITED